MRAHPLCRIAIICARFARSLLVVLAPALLMMEWRSAEAQSYIPNFKSASKKPAALKERSPELEGYGERYDLKEYEACKSTDPRNSRCEIYGLKRKYAPEFWPYHDESPMRWPDPPKEQVYKPGMGPIEYW